MKILVTGVGGQLGYDICRVLYARNLEYCGVDIEDFDITDPLATSKFITQYTPDAIIHCSCYTAVDRAEEEQELCNRVNVTGTENIARAALSVGAKMMYISTDYVFAGEGENFHRPEDPVSNGREKNGYAIPYRSISSCGSPGCLEKTGTILSKPCSVLPKARPI